MKWIASSWFSIMFIMLLIKILIWWNSTANGSLSVYPTLKKKETEPMEVWKEGGGGGRGWEEGLSGTCFCKFIQSQFVDFKEKKLLWRIYSMHWLIKSLLLLRSPFFFFFFHFNNFNLEMKSIYFCWKIQMEMR